MNEINQSMLNDVVSCIYEGMTTDEHMASQVVVGPGDRDRVVASSYYVQMPITLALDLVRRARKTMRG